MSENEELCKICTVIQKLTETYLSEFWVKENKIWEWKDIIKLKDISRVTNVIQTKYKKQKNC